MAEEYAVVQFQAIGLLMWMKSQVKEYVNVNYFLKSGYTPTIGTIGQNIQLKF